MVAGIRVFLKLTSVFDVSSLDVSKRPFTVHLAATRQVVELL